MQRIAFFLFSVLIVTQSFAQPILRESNASPVEGDIFVRHSCGVSRFEMGLAGAGLTWNFAGLTTIAVDTVKYLACAGSATCDSFPGSALYTSSGSSYTYFIADTSKFAVSGQGETGGNMYYSPMQALIKYPLSYGSLANDSFSHAMPAFARYGHGVDSFVADGYGTLLLPTGTYTNALRVHVISVSVDSDIYSTGPLVDTYKTDIYSWYTPGFHSPLLSMYYDIAASGVPELAQVIYFTQYATGIPTENGLEKDIAVYPNPAADDATIVTGLRPTDVSEAYALDVLDRKTPVSYRPGVGQRGNIHCDVSLLPAGLYLLCLKTNLGMLSTKLRIER